MEEQQEIIEEPFITMYKVKWYVIYTLIVYGLPPVVGACVSIAKRYFV